MYKGIYCNRLLDTDQPLVSLLSVRRQFILTLVTTLYVTAVGLVHTPRPEQDL